MLRITSQTHNRFLDAILTENKERLILLYRNLSPDLFENSEIDMHVFVDHVFREGYDKLKLQTFEDIGYFGFVMQICGSWFHLDPLYEPISSNSGTAAGERNELHAADLFQSLTQYGQHCWGDGIQKLKRANAAWLAALQSLHAGDRDMFYSLADVSTMLRMHHRERYDLVGEQGVKRYLEYCIVQACEHGLQGEWYAGILALIGLVFGAGFLNDPLIPWARRSISSGASNDWKGHSLIQHAIADLESDLRSNGLSQRALGVPYSWR